MFFCILIPNFSFFTLSKRTQNSFATIRHALDVLFILIFTSIVIYTEAVVHRYPTRVFSFEICEIFKSTFFYRTLPVAARVYTLFTLTSLYLFTLTYLYLISLYAII